MLNWCVRKRVDWQVLKELCSKCDEACVNSKNLVGRTALHIASLMGLVEAAEVLLKHGAKVCASQFVHLVKYRPQRKKGKS